MVSTEKRTDLGRRRTLRISHRLLALAFLGSVASFGAVASPVPEELQAGYLDAIDDSLETAHQAIAERSSALRLAPAPSGAAESAAARTLRDHRERVERLETRVERWRALSGRQPFRANFTRFLREAHRRAVFLSRVDLTRGIEVARDEISKPLAPEAAAPSASGAVSASVPVNDDCAAAIAIGDGTNIGATRDATPDGSSWCDSGLPAPDVWFTYTAAATGLVVFDTFGSSFDTILSLHSGCPGTTANQVDCNDDDFIGGTLQSQILHSMSVGQEVKVRVSGYDGAKGSFQLTVGPPSTLSGTVTDFSTGQPIAGARIRAYDENGGWRTDHSDVSGGYSFELAPGTYFLEILADGYLAELWQNRLCDLACDPSTGDPITLGREDIFSADIALQPGGGIEGWVSDLDTGAPLGGAEVRIYRSSGSPVDTVYTDPGGGYEAAGLLPGTYYALVDADDYVRELWDDVACSPHCKILSGDPIGVVSGQASRADFALRPGGAIAGVVTEDPGGAPIPGARLSIYRTNGSIAFSIGADQSGVYERRGLDPGDYYVKASDPRFLDELYDDIPCPGFCDVTTGTPIAVSYGTTSAADLALERGGSISGTVTAASTGLPLQRLIVSVYDATGSFVDAAWTDDTGRYEVFGLPTSGVYHAVAAEVFDAVYIAELYDDIACPGGCDPTAGTPIAVLVGVATSGIDFALTFGGGISGRVGESVAGLPVDSAVDIWDAADSWVGSADTNVLGGYAVGGLPTGTYYASTSNRAVYLDELWDDLPCPWGDCTPSTGTPIAVSVAVETAGVDFVLEQGATISGRLTDVANGAEIDGLVQIWSDVGEWVGTDSANPGLYAVTGLPTGTYFARAIPGIGGYHDEIFDDVPCIGSCDTTAGTPIGVTAGTTTTIDFAFCGPPRLEVRLPPDTDPDSFIAGCSVQIDGAATPHHPGCPAIDSVQWSWGDGTGTFAGFPATHDYPPGGGLVTVETTALDVWEGSVATSGTLNLWDCLVAGACGHPDNRSLFDLIFNSTESLTACETITVGPTFELLLPAVLTLRAGDRVEFRSGVAIGNGCRLNVEIDPGLLP